MAAKSYETSELIHESARSVVHRAKRPRDGLEVVIKTPASRASFAGSIARLRNEQRVCDMVDSPHVVRAIELIDEPEHTALVLESFAGSSSLRARGTRRALDLRESLTVALRILDGLVELHAKSVVHKDVKPDNVVVSADLSEVVVIDLGIASVVPRTISSSANGAHLAGTLAFMPPEQTGRVNRAVDYRSDYYCLGATLYWMLTGGPPFADLSEANELVHAQIARIPALISDTHPEVPPVVARIVAKLLHKSADERYQGSFGLRRDLQRCLDELDAGELFDFEIASVDPAEHLRVRHCLYGRERQLAELQGALERIDEGPSLVLLHGPSGCGKTTLVDEFRASLEDRSLRFARGKFDQYDQGQPYAAFSAVLRTLLAHFLDGSEADKELVRERAIAALGPNGRLIVDLVPELELLVGEQPQVSEVGPGDARDRFWDTLTGFIDALLVPEQEFVLFIDDLQWADPPSLRALEALCEGPQRSLLLVLASRETPAEASDAVRALLNEARKRGRLQAELALEPLSASEIEALVDDALDHAPGSQELAALLHQRTQGTPLFIGQLLMSFYAEGAIDIDRASGCWQVDFSRAHAHTSTGDVIDFLVERIDELDQRSRWVLGVASCVGATFDLATLETVCDGQITDVIWAAAAAGFLAPVAVHQGVGAAASVSGTSGELSGVGRSPGYRFVHDRIQQVALQALPRERPALHLEIALRLASVSGAEDRVQSIAAHIGRARELVPEQQRQRFSGISKRAGERAKRAAAYETAARRFSDVLFLLGEDAERRSERLSTTLQHAECLFLAGELDEAGAAFARARELTEGRAELTKLLRLHAALLMVIGAAAPALDLLLEAGRAFGLDLRRGGDQAWVGAMFGAVLGELAGLTSAEISSRPILDDPELLDLLGLISVGINASYISADFNLFSALVLQVIQLSLIHGICDGTGSAFVQLGILLVTGMSDFAGGHTQAKTGFAILERFPDSPVHGQAAMIYGATIHPWVEPMPSSIPSLRAAHVDLRAAGMFTNAGYAFIGCTNNMLATGVPLHQILEGCAAARDYFIKTGDRSNELMLRTELEICQALTTPTHPRGELLPTEFGTREELLEGIVGTPLFFIHAHRAVALYLFEDRPRAAAAVADGEPYFLAGLGSYMSAMFTVLRTLLACDELAAARAEPAEPAELPDQPGPGPTELVEETLAMLRRWEASCPDNARALRHLVEGSWARAQGELRPACEAFAAAADAAADSGFQPHLEGLANERGAAVLLELRDERAALGYLEHALRCYGRWGAVTLQRRVMDKLRGLGYRPLYTSSSTISVSHTSDTGHSLDVASIVKMSQALSEATTLEDVITQLLAITSENAGADRCLLLLDDAGALRVHAESRQGDDELRIFDEPLTLEQAGELLACSLVRRCARTGEAEIIDDAQRGHHRAQDSYLRAQEVRSLLAIPIVKRGERVGLLYLENRVTPGAFSSQHLEVLGSLTAQAAISLDNARLFDALREREAQWRALVTSAPDFIMIINREHRLEFINKVQEGDDITEVIGARVEDFIVPEHHARAGAEIDRVFRTGDYGAYRVAMQGPEGLLHFTTRLGPIMREGVVDRVALISSDITEQLALEEHLRQSQKMQAIGTLAGGVAHDFNNLLTVILGAAELCALDIEDKEAALESVAEIVNASARASALTRQLLAFSRKQVLQPKRVDLHELVAHMSKMLVRLIGEDVILTLERADRPCAVVVDPGQMEQVIMNLAVNARDAMPGGGSLTIRTGEGEGTVVLEVSDTGCGMDEELCQRIFDPFFTTKGEGEGTGLGLPTVLGVVEQSGGIITVDSEPGRGTTFRIELPASTEAASMEPTAGPTDPLPTGSEVVLVVEDEGAVQRLTSRLLALQGYEVLTASGGNEALVIAREAGSLDLLIADVVMPGISGREVAELVSVEHPEIKILYTSGYTDDTIMRHGVLDGTKAFLHKPFTRAELARKIRALLDEA